MKDLAELLNDMCAEGVIAEYALFGAAAQMRYTEAVATLDADVLVSVVHPERLDLLEPIYRFCADRGYEAIGEAIQIGTWPVQFVPAFNRLTSEALEKADTADFEGVPFRVVRAVYLAAIALETGRAKDFARILALLESGSVTVDEVENLARRHSLLDAWKHFKTRFLDD